MSVITYTAFVDRMISKYEGGYGWSKKDPGGPTKFGITCYDLAQHMGQKMDSMSRWAPIVEDMTRETAELIYKTKYATALRYDDLPAGVDACMMDYGVNSGDSRPIHVARAILKIPGGGVMDQALLDAIKKCDPSIFVTAMCVERLQFMHAIRGGAMWAEFGGGWGARVADLKAYCLHLAQGGTPAAAPIGADISHTVQPKAVHVAKTATTPTAGGAIGAGTAAHAAGFPWYVVAGVVVATIAAGVIYEAISAKTTATANTTVVLPPTVVLPTIPAVPAVKPA
jgi:lysozyme family protein